MTPLETAFTRLDRALMLAMDREGIPLLIVGGRLYASMAAHVGTEMEQAEQPVYVVSYDAADFEGGVA